MARLRRAVAFGAIIAVVGVALSLGPIGAALEDNWGLTWLFQARGQVDPPANVFVVSIDRTSSDQLGLDKDAWPPPRHVHAAIVRSLSSRGVSAIVMDVFFRVPRTAAEDADLADAIAASGRVALFESVGRQWLERDEIVQTREPIAPLRDAAAAVGAFPLPDTALVHFFWTFFDSAQGRTPTLPAVALQIHGFALRERLLALLAHAGARDLAEVPTRTASASDFRQMMKGLRRVLEHDPAAAARALALLEQQASGAEDRDRQRLLRALIHLYGGGDRYYLNFYGPPGSIRTIPFHKLLQGDPNVPDLTDAVVFVGEGAPERLRGAEHSDVFRTVYSGDGGRDLSGAEIAATAFANLLTDRALRPTSGRLQLAVLIAMGLTAGLLFRLLPGRHAIVAAILVGTAYWAIAQHQFTTASRLLPLAIPLGAQLPLALFVTILSRYRALRRQVPRELEAGQRPELVHGVCLSTDIENYSVTSEGMEPRTLASLMNEYFDTLGALVTRHGGLMLGRAGDSAMCIWTRHTHQWPLDLQRPAWLFGGRRKDLDQRRKACLAALEIRKVLERFNARHSNEPLPTRIGLHAGDLALGPVGGEYHVIGDTANAASRIEALNKHLATTLLASEAVVDGIGGLCLRPVGAFVVPGRKGALRIAEIIGEDDAVDAQSHNLCRRFAAALAFFEQGRWEEARTAFQAIATDFPADGPTRYYLTLSEQRARAESTIAPGAIVIDSK